MKLLAVAASGAILISGCSSVSVRVKKEDSSKTMEVAAVQGDAYTKAGMINETNTKLLQAVASETLKSGNSYFSFEAPATVANFKLDKADDFVLKCASKSVGASLGLSVLTLGMGGGLIMDDCDMYSGFSGVGKASSTATIKVYSEKPSSAAFDAKAVIEDLKAKKLYLENIGEIEYK